MTPLEARIAEVLAPLLYGEGRLQWERKWEDSSPLVKSAWSVLAREYATMLAPVIREAQAEALREAVSDFEAHIGVGEFAVLSQRGHFPWGHLEEAWGLQGPYMDWLRTRADNLEAS